MVNLPHSFHVQKRAMETPRSEYIRNYDHYLPKMLEDERAYTYIRQAYDYMELMKPGTILHLQAPEEKLPWLLVTAGAFFSAQDHWMEFDFNDDWTKLRRNQPFPPGFVKYLKGKQKIPEP